MAATAQKKKPEEVQLPAIEKAAEVRRQLFGEVYFAKLAELGYQPTSVEEEAIYLDLADKALVLAQHPAVKKAELARSPAARLNEKLSSYMAQYGIGQQPEQKSAQLNQTALAYASVPDVYISMLSLAQG